MASVGAKCVFEFNVSIDHGELFSARIWHATILFRRRVWNLDEPVVAVTATTTTRSVSNTPQLGFSGMFCFASSPGDGHDEHMLTEPNGIWRLVLVFEDRLWHPFLGFVNECERVTFQLIYVLRGEIEQLLKKKRIKTFWDATTE